MAIPLIIDKVAKANIQAVIEFAHDNFLDEGQMASIMASGWAPGDVDEYSCNLHVGFRVVYTVEKHQMGWCKHLSMSLAKEGRSPSPEAVDMVLEEFGFQGRITKRDKSLYVYLEDKSVVNVIEPLEIS